MSGIKHSNLNINSMPAVILQCGSLSNSFIGSGLNTLSESMIMIILPSHIFHEMVYK